MEFEISLFDNKRDAVPKTAKRTWAQTCERINRPQVRTDKDGPLFSPARFEPARRLKANVVVVCWLVLDYDHEADWQHDLDVWRGQVVAFAAYTTHSHNRTTKQNPNAEDRFRVILPLVVPIPVALFPALWQWAAKISGGKIDASASDCSRMFYTPAKAAPDAPYSWDIHEGPFLDWRKLDLSEPQDKPPKNLPASAQSANGNGFADWDALNEETRQRIRALPGAEIMPNGWLSARGVCHGGKGPSGLYIEPDGLAYGCRKKCDSATIRRALSLPETPPGIGWTPDEVAREQPPLPLEEYPRQPFPCDALPGTLRDFVFELARETQTPPDLAGLQVLAVCAGAVAGKAFVQARNAWIEPLNLYLVSALDVGNRKTAVFSNSIAPLQAIEKQLRADSLEAIALALCERRIKENELAEFERIAGKGKTPQERMNAQKSARELAKELANMIVPVEPQLYASGDVTPEALVELVAAQKGRICLFSDEGELFEIIAGRYNKGTPNIDALLKLHTGEAIKVNRRGRRIEVEKGVATIGLSVQPAVLDGLSTRPTFRGRGLLARFLYSRPYSFVGWRDSRPEPMRKETRLAYESTVSRLAAWRADAEPVDALKIMLSPEADRLLQKLQDEIEPQLRPVTGKLSHIADWVAKLCGAVVRLAGVLHCVQHATKPDAMPESITAETFQRAVTLGHYFTAHAQAAFGMMGADPAVGQAKYLLRWMQAAHIDTFTKSEAQQTNRSQFRRVEDIEPAIALLVEHRYLFPLGRNEPRSAGRRPSPRFIVNPHVLAVTENTENTENTTPQSIFSNFSNFSTSNDGPETDAEETNDDWGEL